MCLFARNNFVLSSPEDKTKLVFDFQGDWKREGMTEKYPCGKDSSISCLLYAPDQGPDQRGACNLSMCH